MLKDLAADGRRVGKLLNVHPDPSGVVDGIVDAFSAFTPAIIPRRKPSG
jgi:hypothetical protein